MRLKLVIDINQEIPFSYHHYLQGMIYHAIEDSSSVALHDQGIGESNYKYFTFSELKGPYINSGKGIRFTKPAYLYITSASASMLNHLYIEFMENPKVRIGRNTFNIIGIEPINDDVIFNENNHYVLRTLSPITCYKTDRKGYTTYFDARSSDFEDSIISNLQKKFKALFESDDDEFIEFIDIRKIKEVKVKYKNVLYVAYNLEMEAKISDEYLRLLLHSGLGAKNSAGFGMMELIKE